MKSNSQIYDLYRGDLDEILDEIFEISDDKGWQWYNLAAKAGLCYKTVDNIGWRKTKTPHFQTVWKLARAVGLKLHTAINPRGRLRKAS